MCGVGSAGLNHIGPTPKITTGTGIQGHVAKCLPSLVHDQRSLSWIHKHRAASFATLLTVILFPVTDCYCCYIVMEGPQVQRA